MKLLLLLLLLIIFPIYAFSYPKEVDELYVKLYSAAENKIDEIETAIKKVENINATGSEKQTYLNIVNTTMVRLDKNPKKNKKEKFENLKNIIDNQETYFSSTDPEYLASAANLIIASVQYASLSDIIKYSKQAVSLYEAAIEIEPNHFESLMGYGILRGFQPSFVGGGIKKSLPLLEKAINNAKTDHEKYQIYIWVSQAYLEEKDEDKYKKYFLLAENIYPNALLTKKLKEINAKNKTMFDMPSR